MMMDCQRKDWGEACIHHVETEHRMEGNPESAAAGASAGAGAMESRRAKSKSATAGYGGGTNRSTCDWSRPLAKMLTPPDLQSWSF